MSLDCYPFGQRKTIKLNEQPIALDVAYDDNLFISVIDKCKTIVIYDLTVENNSDLTSSSSLSSHSIQKSSPPVNKNNDTKLMITKFSLGENIVIDQIIYNNKFDYLACVGHKNGLLSVYTVFNWRQVNNCNEKLVISEIEFPSTTKGGEEEVILMNKEVNNDITINKEKLNCIDCCQRTGNLAIACGDVVLIYKYLNDNKDLIESINQTKDGEIEEVEKDSDSIHSKADTVKEFNDINQKEEELETSIIVFNNEKRKYFSHIISVKLTIIASKICLLENYLSITSIDHVQILKLELLTLQIQSDLSDPNELQQLDLINQNDSKQKQQLQLQQQQKQLGKQPVNYNNSDKKNSINKVNSANNNNNNETRSDATSTTSATTLGTTTTCSMISDTNSTTTNFSSFTNPTSLDNNNLTAFNNSDISIITMNQQQQQLNESELNNNDSNQSVDDCITWNLNTKKLVKLPTLMHNTSTNLSSYHICHPLELLGPASESIACRVNCSIYSDDFCQNQLESIVMLCKQFDFEKDPIKTTYLKAIYLSNYEDFKRLNKNAIPTTLESNNDIENPSLTTNARQQQQQQLQNQEIQLLKSNDYELIASVTCFISTLTNCFLYSLHGKKVVRTQTIMHPDLSLDLRPDLLNVYLLSPLGLQICSSGICDSTFRYDWSSSADLNLSFIATSKTLKILTTKKYLILLGSEASKATPSSSSNELSSNELSNQCIVEYMEKPDLISLYDRIVHTIKRCNSISIRSNMLTYLHATAQLTLLLNDDNNNSSNSREVLNILKTVTIMLAKQLLQKKQTNVIMNSKIDKAIKHLLDISMCDLSELMKRHLEALSLQQENAIYIGSSEIDSDFDSLSNNNNNQDQNQNQNQNKLLVLNKNANQYSSIVFNGTTLGDDDEPLDTDYELIKIYLKYAKFSQSLLDYLIKNSDNKNFCSRIIDYMFEHNPRLLIKCAQRYPITSNSNNNSNLLNYNDDYEDNEQVAVVEQQQELVLLILVERLKQLAEFDSTGINRTTVLFTLAILYNALNEKQKCLLALDQIKPSNHLAITMCSNYEHSHSIANLVIENYPDVYKLFLLQLTKKDKFAAQEYIARHGQPACNNKENQLLNKAKSSNSIKSSLDDNGLLLSDRNQFLKLKKKKSQQHNKLLIVNNNADLDLSDNGNDCFSSGGDNNSSVDDENHLNDKEIDDGDGDGDDDVDDNEQEDEQELYEKKLKLFNEIPTIDLIDLLLSKPTNENNYNKENDDFNGNNDNVKKDVNYDDDYENCRPFIEASINLLESQFILARLRENSLREN